MYISKNIQQEFEVNQGEKNEKSLKHSLIYFYNDFEY